MITAYMYGKDIGWLLTLFILFFFVGGVIALAMLVIPERYKMFFHRGYVFVISVFFSIAGIVSLAVLSCMTFTLDELETGKHWKQDCMLMEVNVPTGTFTADVNKLNCAGVIINVPMNKFNAYTSQWEMYNGRDK